VGRGGGVRGLMVATEEDSMGDSFRLRHREEKSVANEVGIKKRLQGGKENGKMGRMSKKVCDRVRSYKLLLRQNRGL
jgi:hypothetical protein